MSLPLYTRISLRLLLLVSVTLIHCIHNHERSIPTPGKKIEEVLILEAQYGPISGYEPVITNVLNYLSEVNTCTANEYHILLIQPFPFL